MNLKVLPPKRFQDPYDPYYDSIRHEPWFHRVLIRRVQNERLARAYREVLVNHLNQKQSCALHGVDARELRDYTNWVDKTPRTAVSASFQGILDGAYEVYCDHKLPFRNCIERVAPLFGVPKRHVVEQWEIDPSFWPTGYPPYHQ